MPQSAPELRQSISWVQGSAMTIGAVLGSGVLVLPGTAAVLAGPASLVNWLLMGLLAIPLAMTLGRLGAAHPDAGGIASFARRAFGPGVEAVTGTLFLGTVPIGAPIVALIGANYLGRLFAAVPWQVSGLAAGMLLASRVEGGRLSLGRLSLRLPPLSVGGASVRYHARFPDSRDRPPRLLHPGRT
ncbi:MAG: amino acid permease [Peptococcaceae bacterium]|jgi:amino acid efflux transporter|nr:amino acid permease [Peptococcaceae bacterium]